MVTGCTINGKHFTTYEAVQIMRKLETRVRHEKDKAIAAEAAGDDKLREDCQHRINRTMRQYYDVAKAAGVRARSDRTVVPGFHPLKGI